MPETKSSNFSTTGSKIIAQSIGLEKSEEPLPPTTEDINEPCSIGEWLAITFPKPILTELLSRTGEYRNLTQPAATNRYLFREARVKLAKRLSRGVSSQTHG